MRINKKIPLDTGEPQEQACGMHRTFLSRETGWTAEQDQEQKNYYTSDDKNLGFVWTYGNNT